MRPLDHISAFLPVSLAATLAAIPLAGQEILAVDFGGNAVAVSPYTGETLLTPSASVGILFAIQAGHPAWISAAADTTSLAVSRMRPTIWRSHSSMAANASWRSPLRSKRVSITHTVPAQLARPKPSLR